MVRHNHASGCFLVWLPVLVLHVLPLCIISTVFCFPWWASPTDGCVWSFHCICCGVLQHLFAPAPADTWLQRLCPSRQSRFLICAETALVYFYVAVVPRGTLGWTCRSAPVCRCPGRGIHVTPTIFLDITSDGSTRFSALAGLRMSFLQLHEQPQTPPLWLRSYTVPLPAIDTLFF